MMADTPENVPTFVVATPDLHADGPPTLFRSYQCTGYNADKCTIWEAARATSAAPTFFKPIKIEIPTPGGTFVDGGLTHNNPAELALLEAQRIWSTVKRFCLVSIGTGRLKSVKVVDRPSSVSAGSSSGAARSSSLPRSKRPRVEEPAARSTDGLSALIKIGEICVQLATNSEFAHQRLLRHSQSDDPDKQFPYHRFNVERDMHEIELQEWDQMEAIGSHATAYMDECEGESKRDKCVQDLMNPAPIQCKSTP
jgi:patatin-like phospholipase/acyl hydrolase